VTHVVDVVLTPEAGGERPGRSSPEETALAPSTPEGWYPDPLDPTRRRRWDGRHWTARVSGEPGAGAPDLASIHWTPTVFDAPVPQAAEPEPPVVVPEPVPLLTFPRSEAAAVPDDLGDIAAPTGGAGVDPILAAFGAEARPAAPEVETTHPRSRRMLIAVAIAAATVLVAGAAVAGAGLLRSDEQRPTVLPEQSYRDGRAGFALRYPDGWHVLRRQRGNGIRFAIGAPDAPTTDTNTVSVVVGSDSTPLPPLHTLADQLTETLRAQLPGVRLESAARSRLADAPAFRFTFRDPDATPPTRIDQYVGRTTSGRPLTVTVTVREPRTAPSARQLNEFVGSLDPS
jgi:hypothetical protein